MDFTNVTLLNFIDKLKLSDNDPNITVQRLVRYNEIASDFFENAKEADMSLKIDEKKAHLVLSITRRHWDVFDNLVDHYSVEPAVLFDAVKRYQKMTPCHFDQALEICLEMIWTTFDLGQSVGASGGKTDKILTENDIKSISYNGSRTLH